MNRKGSFFLATFTVVAVFVFIIFVSMNKEKILEESRIVDTGELPEIAINATLDEGEIELFLDIAIEYSYFNALKKLGNDGGILNGQECGKINGYVIWKDDCLFSYNLEENFFSRFKTLFDEYLKARGINGIDAEWKIDENNRLVIELNGVIEFDYEGAKVIADENIR